MSDRIYDVICTYCGDAYQCRDHVIPATTEQCRTYSAKRCVSCCMHCNVILGSRAIHNVPERAEYIANHLRTKPKYKKILNMPDWSDEEIREMGWTMRSVISHKANLKRWVSSRLSNLDRVTTGYTSRAIFDAYDPAVRRAIEALIKREVARYRTTAPA